MPENMVLGERPRVKIAKLTRGSSSIHLAQ
jgi:hypothetical protein